MTWQPIATAPKDGSQVLAWGRVIGCRITYWVDSPHDYWFFAQGATHWMKLPEPPT